MDRARGLGYPRAMTAVHAAPPAAPIPWAAEARATLSLGWPIVLTNLAQMAIMTTDIVFMGWIGPEALAAGTLGVNLTFAVFMFGMGLANATAPMMAQAIGRNRHDVRDVRRSVRAGLWATTGYALFMWLVLWNGGALFHAMGQDPGLADLAGDYTRALLLGTMPALWFVVLRCFVAALERPRAAAVATVLAIAFNAAADYVLMFGHLGFPAMGVVGAGIASALTNAFMFAVLLGVCLADRRFRRYRLLGRIWRTDRARLRELFAIGVPIGFSMSFETWVFNVGAFLMGAFGAVALAAHAVALQVAAITFMVPMGISQAATVRVGLAAGRGDPAGVHRAGWCAIALGLGFMACSAAGMLLAPEAVVGLFLDGADPAGAEAWALAVLLLMLAGVFQLVDGGQVLGAGVLRGLKDTRVPMLFTAVGYWVLGLPVGAALAFWGGLGPAGIWIGFCTGLGSVALMMLARWAMRERLGLVRPA